MRTLKRLSWLIVLLLVFHSVAVAESSTSAVELELTLTSIAMDDMSAKDIMASEESRALISVLLWTDFLLNADEDFSAQLLENSYVGRSSLSIDVYIHGESNDLMMVYTPIIDKAYYILGETMPDAIIESSLDEVCEDGYYKNDIEEVLRTMLALKEAIASNLNGYD